MKNLIPLLIWVVVIGAVFGFLWWQGHLLRLANYIQETKDELRKCTWPSIDELKGSTVVIMVTTVLLGFFTVAVDFAFTMIMRLVMGNPPQV